MVRGSPKGDASGAEFPGEAGMVNGMRHGVLLAGALAAFLASADVRPAHAQSEGSFISADTVVIGCTAGGGASAFAAVLPLMTTAFGGVGTAITPAVVAAWTGIGCAVGIVSGLIAIGTAWGMETWREGRSANDEDF